jgi:hypothetical protein
MEKYLFYTYEWWTSGGDGIVHNGTNCSGFGGVGGGQNLTIIYTIINHT